MLDGELRAEISRVPEHCAMYVRRGQLTNKTQMVLTDNAIIVTRFHVGDRDLDTPVENLEVRGQGSYVTASAFIRIRIRAHPTHYQ